MKDNLQQDEDLKISDRIYEFATFIENSIFKFHKYKDIDNEMLKKQNDYLHDFEAEEQTYHETARIGKQLRELRRNRRKYKNAYIIYEPLVAFVKKYCKNTTNDIIHDLRSLADDIRKVEAHLTNQIYNTRSKVPNVQELSIDNGKDSNKIKEDLIIINNIISKYSSKYSSIINENYSTDHTTRIDIQISLPNIITYSNSSQMIYNIGELIEKKFNFDKKYYVKYKLSDLLIQENSKDKMTAIISIYDCSSSRIIKIDDESVYELHISIYGKRDTTKKQKKKKNRKKR